MSSVSASAISAFDETVEGGCRRKWAFKYVAKVVTPPAPAAALGVEVDDEQIQPYLRDGRPFDFSRPSGSGYIAEAMRPHLPAPRVVEVQHEITMPSPSWATHPFVYRGYADLWTRDSRSFPLIAAHHPWGVARPVPGVGDTKTTGDIAQWAKTERSLATDVQAMIYATAALWTYRDAHEVDLLWIYGQTRPKDAKTRKSKVVHLRVTSEHVAGQFRLIDSKAREIHETRAAMVESGASPLDLPPNPAACETFGGCPFRSLCNLGPDQVLDAYAAKAERKKEQELPMTNPLAALQALQARRAGGAPVAAPAAAPVAAPAAAPVAAPVAVPTALPVTVTFDPSWSDPVQPVTPPGVVHVSGPVTLPGKIESVSVQGSIGINPPETTLPPAPPVSSGPKGRATKVALPPIEAGKVGRVVWAEERFTPAPYQSCGVGPFEADVTVRPGETTEQAYDRAYSDLSAFAERMRERKLASFAAKGGAK